MCQVLADLYLLFSACKIASLWHPSCPISRSIFFIRPEILPLLSHVVASRILIILLTFLYFHPQSFYHKQDNFLGIKRVSRHFTDLIREWCVKIVWTPVAYIPSFAKVSAQLNHISASKELCVHSQKYLYLLLQN